ncbi:thioredoxin-like protein [Bombardia bombarda]|uniref:thioredoxin-dependent peroxiredoxin n=1 Tax=Bombardia bombarda TaxID=252184 RepID=A0AA40CFU2_9PEZI|nr:thioredoxin-like protein [Bombardia bombarda]
MPVELRKRKAPAPPPAPPAKKQSKVAKVVKTAATKVKDAAAANGSAAKPKAAGKPPVVGDVISLEGFGGEIETNDGTKTTLKALVDASKAGVVLFTYPRASTPGCTKQACLFRDSYVPLTAHGLAIYGLSTDSPKANTAFQTKQKLPYPLLCDPNATLIAAIGLKKAPKGTTRGVFVVDKAGNVLAAEAGSPDGTVTVVKKIVADVGAGDRAKAAAEEDEADEEAEAEGKEPEEKKEEVEAETAAAAAAPSTSIVGDVAKAAASSSEALAKKTEEAEEEEAAAPVADAVEAAAAGEEDKEVEEKTNGDAKVEVEEGEKKKDADGDEKMEE